VLFFGADEHSLTFLCTAWRAQTLQEFQKMALGPAGSVVRVRTRSRAGTLNVVSITRLSSLASSQSTPSTTVAVPNSVSSTGVVPSSEQSNTHITASQTGKSSSGRAYPAKATMQVLAPNQKQYFDIFPLTQFSLIKTENTHFDMLPSMQSA
jgi:hypothetical protein